MTLAILMLAVSLSIDAFGVATVYGLRKIKIPLLSKLFICVFSIVYSGISLILGKTLYNLLDPQVSKYIGVAILFIMGIYVIIQARSKESQSNNRLQKTKAATGTLLSVAIKSFGITIQVIRNPVEMDMDNSGIIDIRESLLLGFALSLDAIGVTLGSAMAGCNSYAIPFVVGVFQLLFLYAGLIVGNKLSSFEKINGRLLSFLPGIILITLAIARMI